MKTNSAIMPRQLRILETLGENIKLARLRRKLSAEQVAERAGIARMTLYKVEQGLPNVAIGAYLQVLLILGLQTDLANVASDDVFGRKLQDAGLITKKRAPKN
jgi:transcriptional regulator with XRE-family HTH domain